MTEELKKKVAWAMSQAWSVGPQEAYDILSRPASEERPLLGEAKSAFLYACAEDPEDPKGCLLREIHCAIDELEAFGELLWHREDISEHQWMELISDV
jgi:hypothetical protein